MGIFMLERNINIVIRNVVSGTPGASTASVVSPAVAGLKHEHESVLAGNIFLLFLQGTLKPAIHSA